MAKETGGRSSLPDPTGSPSSEEHFVDKYKTQLIQGASNAELVLDELLTKAVIQQDSYDKISALPTSEEKMRELLDGHLKTVGDKDIFYNIIAVPQHNHGPRLESGSVERQGRYRRWKKFKKKLKLIYEGSDPNFLKVFIENPDSKFQLTLKHKSGTVWTCAIRKDDCQNTGDVQVMCDKELARLRPKLVDRVSRELINQLLDDLLEDGVLNNGEKDLILQENSTSANRARRLIDMILKKHRHIAT